MLHMKTKSEMLRQLREIVNEKGMPLATEIVSNDIRGTKNKVKYQNDIVIIYAEEQIVINHCFYYHTAKHLLSTVQKYLNGMVE